MRRHALVLVALLVAACGQPRFSPPTPPSEDAAAGLLHSVVDIVKSGDLDRLCSVGAGTCPKTLRDSDPRAVPQSEPVVVGTRVVPSSANADGTWNVGGRVLELCGRDGLNRPYYSEMLVFEQDGRLIATQPVYWTGIRIAVGSTVGGPAPTPPPCPEPSAG